MGLESSPRPRPASPQPSAALASAAAHSLDPMDTTKALAIFGAVTGTVGTLWALFLSVVYDRARVSLTVTEAWQMQVGGPRLQVLWVKVRNRGRRVTHIETVSRVVSAWRGGHEMSADIAQQLTTPVRLEEGQSHNFIHGGLGGYAFGAMPLRRWYVIDGGSRIFPLRERYRQRAESIVFWPTRAYFRRQRHKGQEKPELEP
jgi:hypothetical protein